MSFNHISRMFLPQIIQKFCDLQMIFPDNFPIIHNLANADHIFFTLLLEEYGFYVTPMDGSEEMCKLAEVNTDKEVLQMTYDEMEFDDVFDGIWACASLIHLTEDEMRKVMKKLVQALKENGVLYFSVHRGDRDGIYHGRYFHDYNRRELQSLMEEYPELEVVDIWTTQDVRSEKSDKLWLNVLARKTGKE